jgi:hypothetical protein
MSNFDSDGSPDSEWEDRGDVAWNEFDWERYLREQDDAIQRYLRFYDAAAGHADRIDVVAEKMGWGQDDWSDDQALEGTPREADDSSSAEEDVYTLHKNPIFIATKAITLGLRRDWIGLAVNSHKVPQALAVSFLASLQNSEEQATQAIHALDFGDYAMAVSLFKRAMSALNGSLALLNSDEALHRDSLVAWRADAQPRLFDLREIWLRVIAECRDELERPADDEN